MLAPGEIVTDSFCGAGGLVTVIVDNVTHVIVDICMRMLTPRELARCQGFDDSYDIDLGGTLSKGLTVRGIGNSVCLNWRSPSPARTSGWRSRGSRYLPHPATNATPLSERAMEVN